MNEVQANRDDGDAEGDASHRTRLPGGRGQVTCTTARTGKRRSNSASAFSR